MKQPTSAPPIDRSESLYLQQLNFEQSAWRSPIAPLLVNARWVILLLLTLLIGGVGSFLSLRRELNPEIDFPIVIITTILPGANPSDVESLITKPIETEVSSTPGLDRLTSSTSSGLSVVTLEFSSTADSSQVLDAVKERVDVVDDLPEDASTPRVIKLDFNDQAVWRFAVVGQTDPVALSELAVSLQEKLEDAATIREVDLIGQEDRQVAVALTPTGVVQYGLTPAVIGQWLRGTNVTVPAGSLSAGNVEYLLSIDGNFSTLEELRALPIPIQGSSVSLGEVAEVTERSAESDRRSVVIGAQGEPQQAVELLVYKTDAASISQAAADASKIVGAFLAEHPVLSVITIENVAQDIATQFAELNSNFVSTIFLVFGVLVLFLGARQAAIAAFSIPLTFLATFMLMQLFGITLNFLSLFSLLLALGLVVDDAIVVVESMASYRTKFSPIEAGLLVYRDFIVPIWTTTLTTVWAFLPLLLSTGIIGEFIKSIPIVVSAALMSSTTIAVIINLPMTVLLYGLQLPRRVRWLLAGLFVAVSSWAVVVVFAGSPLLPIVLLCWLAMVCLVLLVPSQRPSKSVPLPHVLLPLQSVIRQVQDFVVRLSSGGVVSFSPVVTFYRKMLRHIVTNRPVRMAVLAGAVLFLVVSFGFVGLGLTPAEFFPRVDQDQLYVSVELPAGTPEAETYQRALALLPIISEQPDIADIVLRTGDDGPTSESKSGSQVAFFTLRLVPESERELGSIRLAERLREQFAAVQGMKVLVVESSGGPPAGADLQVNIYGADLGQLSAIADEFATRLSAIPEAENVQVSLVDSPGQLSVQVDTHRLHQLGVTSAELGGWLRSAVTGTETGEVTLDDEELPIVVTTSQAVQSPGVLQTIPLPSRTGGYTLADVAELQLVTSPVEITRQDGERVIRVTAAAAMGISAPNLLRAFESAVSDYSVPAGYRWDIGGANEENQESTNSIFAAMGVSLVLIIITMVLQLGSFRKAALVVLIIPFAVAGVFFNFTLLQIPLSFPALIGVLALFGIVVNNTIMLMDKINQSLSVGLGYVDGIIDACSSRVQAIFFTSATTIVGLLPISISDPLWRGLGGAIVAGLSVSGILILVVLPAVYVEVFGDEQKKNT